MIGLSLFLLLSLLPLLLLLLLPRPVHPESGLCQYSYVSSGQSEEGTFSTPQYPNAYPANTRCTFHFRAANDQVVWIDWRQFHLEHARSDIQQCLNDYVEVVIIDFQNRQHVKGRYCGDVSPPNFHTMQRSVDIIFRSSFTHHYKGFEGVYRFIDEKDIQPPVSSQTLGSGKKVAYSCGGFAAGRHGGVIQNPGYPDMFPDGVECNWIIRVEPPKRIVIKLLELELTDSMAECGSARLEVLDGYAHSMAVQGTDPKTVPKIDKEQQVRFCGDAKYYKDEGEKSYMSDRNRVLVRFITTKGPSDNLLTKRKLYGKPVGFKLVWTEVEAEKSETGKCDQFFCRGGEFCIEAVCTERWRYCIDNSLVCDGVPHCAEFDESDEENCYSTEIIGAGVSIFVFLVVVIVSVVCCQRLHNRHHLKRHKHDFSDEGVLHRHNRTQLDATAACPSDPHQDQHIELKALPANYHGYSNGKRSNCNSTRMEQEEKDMVQPFLQQRASSPERRHACPPSYDVCQTRRRATGSLPPVVVRVPNLMAQQGHTDNEDDVWEIRHGEGIPLMPMHNNTASNAQHHKVPPPVAPKPRRQISIDESRQDPPPPPPPPLPLKPILKSTPPPVVPECSNAQDSRPLHVGFAQHPLSLSRPVPPPLLIVEEDRDDDEDDSDENQRSPSPWHHQVTPTEV